MAKNTNAKQEFLNHIGQKNSNLSGNSIRKVLCASIQKGDDYGDDDEIIERTVILTTGYTKENWNDFLSKLNFMYDSGYGGQELFGTIWYVDGTWSERGIHKTRIDYILPKNIVDLCKGNELVSGREVHIREGVVLRPYIDRTAVDGTKLRLKIINPAYKETGEEIN